MEGLLDAPAPHLRLRVRVVDGHGGVVLLLLPGRRGGGVPWVHAHGGRAVAVAVAGVGANHRRRAMLLVLRVRIGHRRCPVERNSNKFNIFCVNIFGK